MQALRYLMIVLIFLVSCSENIQEKPSQNTSTQVNPTIATTQAVGLQNTQGFKKPKVWFVTPQSGYETDKASVEIQVKTENVAEAADTVIFFLNGRPMRTVKAAKARAQTQSHTQRIPLIVGENWITVQVRGKAGAIENSEPLLIMRQGGKKPKPKPDLYYLGIGVSAHPQLPLKYPAKDVKGLETVLKQQPSKAYRRVISKTITDQQATRGNLINAIKTFFNAAKMGDIAILFISGHGMNTTKNGYHFVTYDTDVDNLAATSASWKIFDAINYLKANVLLFVDTDHAGAIIANSKWKEQSQVEPSQFLRNAHNHNVVIFAASSGSGFAMEKEEWGHGQGCSMLIVR